MNFGIIAAGEGSRLAQEGVALPKPLVKIQGVPMIERLIRIFESLNPERIVVCINEFMPEVRAFLEQFRCKEGVELVLCIKTTPSSMHTFKEVSASLKGRGRFVLTTVDTIFHESDFIKYAEAWQHADATVDALMAVTDYIDDEKPLYVKTAPDNRITGFLDYAEPGVKYVSGGIYGLSDKAVDVLDQCLAEGKSRMRNYQRALIEDNLNVMAWPMGKIIDVDHAGDIAKADAFLSEGA